MNSILRTRKQFVNSSSFFFVDDYTCERCYTSYYCLGDGEAHMCGRCEGTGACDRSPTEHSFGASGECSACPIGWVSSKILFIRVKVKVMVFNATFNNIWVISLRSVLLVEETGENHRPVASHWQILSHNVVSSTHCLSGIRTHNFGGNIHWLHR